MNKNDRVTLPNAVVPSHYALELHPDLDASKLDFLCTLQVNCEVVESVSEITLHSKEISISSASFTPNATNASSISMSEITYNVKQNTVKITFDTNIPNGEGVLSIKYRGILNSDMAGFYKSSYADANGTKKIMASTQFEALDARRAFPCWDEPAVKATFAVTMVIPVHLTAISNMPEKSCIHLPTTPPKKKITFHTTPKMSTYLLAWAVGEFDFVEGTTKGGVSIRVFSPPGRAEQGLFALDVGIRSLDFYDSFFKVPYPLPKLDMLCVTEFAMGAMENWGLVTYRETALMIDEKKASSQAKQRVAIVVAHELAHQWFGNLVTMSWWDGLWLNEGFAAFMEHFAVDALFPDYKIWEQYTTDAFGSAQRLDSLKSSHPVIVPIKHAEEVEQVFDAISYCKGSTVVNMVAAIIGKENFRDGLALYMSRHAYQNTETVDLWNAWSEVSKKDISALMSTWTTVTGYPFLKILSEKWTDSEVIFTLEQSRFLADGSVDEEATVWSIPLLFATPGLVSEEAVIMDQKVQTFAVPLDKSIGVQDQWIKINAGQKALVRVAHSPEMTKRLISALTRGGLSVLSPVDRAALLLDGYALAKAGLAPLDTVIDILKVLMLLNEESSIVSGAMQGVLNAFYILVEELASKTASQDTLQSFVAFGKKYVVGALSRVGWDAKPDEGHTDKLLRSTILGMLDTFAWNDPSVAAEAKRRFDLHFTDPTALPAEYKTTVYRIVLMNGGEAEYNKIHQTYTSTEDNQERKYAMYSLGAALDEKLKKKTLDWAVKSGEVKLQDYFYPIGSVAHNIAGSDLAWAYFKENFSTLKEMLSKASPSLMDAGIVNSISRFCSAARADEVEAFFAANPLPSSERRISQQLESMRTSAKMVDMIASSNLSKAEYWA